MKIFKTGILIIGLVFIASVSNVYAASTDTGVISTLYATPEGSVAIQLDSGYPNAVANAECATFNSWAGHTAADSYLKSAILTAYAAKKQIKVVTLGCAGNWVKIVAIYVYN